MTETTKAAAEVAVIGGSGFYEIEGLADPVQVEVDTPFGRPSAALTIGTLHGRRVAFLARHAPGHRILPSELPARANIHALRQIGVRHVIGVSAVGSLREDIAPLHAVIPDQVIDRTNGRPATFFGEGMVAHVGFADPFCPALRTALIEAGQSAGATVHDGGSIVVIEGPAFSTRAESNLYRSWGASIIGMTTLPEARLAREAELCYASLALVTDYDVWHESEEDVTAEAIVRNLQQNVGTARAAVVATVGSLEALADACECRQALRSALVTQPEDVPAETRQRLSLLLERYWGPA